MNWQRLRKLKIRLHKAWLIATGQTRHWVLIEVKHDQFVKQITGRDYTVEMSYHGTQEYLAVRMIHAAASNWDETDLLLLKVEYEGKIESLTEEHRNE